MLTGKEEILKIGGIKAENLLLITAVMIDYRHEFFRCFHSNNNNPCNIVNTF